MDIFGGIVIFIVCWWLVLFMLLPIGAEPEETPVPGNAESAPAKPRLLIKMLAATVLAGLLTLGAHYLLDSGWIDFSPDLS